MPMGPKRKNLKGPGKCIFCGRVAGLIDDQGKTVSMSKQHLWPEWLQTPFPQTETSHASFQTRFRHLPGKTLKIQPFLQTHQGDVKARKLRIICKDHCNGGWISGIENSTKEFLIDLINAENFVLTENYQRLLALWLSVACIVWEFTDPPTQAIQPEDRDYVYCRREPPPNWSMWIGRYQGSEWKTRYRHHGAYAMKAESFSPNDIVGAQPSNSQTSSLLIGELFMHVFSSTIPCDWEFEQGVNLPGLFRLWPLRGGNIRWPGIFILSDADVNAIADRMLTSSFEGLKSVSW
jgi:hypothetical protein